MIPKLSQQAVRVLRHVALACALVVPFGEGITSIEEGINSIEESDDLIQLQLSLASGSLLRVSLNHTGNNHFGLGGAVKKYGSSKCPCIGIDNIEGTTETTLGTYPADVGAHCEQWEKDRIGDCKGADPPSWCEDSWCYVDPCNCDLEVLPKISTAQPNAQYQGKTLYYSYATCGSVDKWTESEGKACVNYKDKGGCNGNDKCLWSDSHNRCGGKELMGVCKKPSVDYKWGKPDCRCVGIDGQEGNTTVRISKDPEKHMDYPADVGATCDAWDMDRHPDCKGDNKANWCIQRWCFVDPCKCNLPESPPKGSIYLPEATSAQGRPLFYSYWTCGSEDLYMDKEEQRKALSKQAAVCSSAWAATPLVGLVLAAFINV